MESEVITKRREYIAALRSGLYSQTTGKLVEDDGLGLCYCALGVLFAINKCKLDETGLSYDPDAYCQICHRLEIAPYGQVTRYDTATKDIVEMNDEFFLSFKQIADRLEERWGLLPAEPSQP